ncbi:MAG TPA: signal recognition particle receptor subunit alpha [Candidatus Nanoarchaeia archaeon]|nr:signal recognition particle receptor subunit alpha [Candidatus Nanoarchaeia archaeon]
MLDKLASALRNTFDKIAGAIFIDKKTIESVVRELQRALLEADVNVQLVMQLSEKLRKAAADEKIKGVEKREHMIKLLHDELLNIAGKEKQEINLAKKKQTKIMLIGLYGSGKTTTAAKLGNYYTKRGFKSALLGLDVHRPAAPEQLEQLAERANLSCFIDKQEKNALKIWEKYRKELQDFELLVIDTAGRHDLDSELVGEIKKLNKEIKPDYVILVIAADIGQAAKKQAAEFKKACGISGVIITRMDSTAKAGGALTACAETGANVLFISTGEKINDIEPFNPETFISRLLGMGDLQSLIEKVKLATGSEIQKNAEKRLKEGTFTLVDFYEQLKSMQNLGPLDKVMELIPGLGKAKEKIPENLLGTQEEKMKKWKYAIDSMTIHEKESPEILEKQTSRMQRIAKGAGITTSDVRSLIKQYKMIKEFGKGGMPDDLSQGFSQKQIQELAKKFGRKIRI